VGLDVPCFLLLGDEKFMRVMLSDDKTDEVKRPCEVDEDEVKYQENTASDDLILYASIIDSCPVLSSSVSYNWSAYLL
jgi:hypothetical protein